MTRACAEARAGASTVEVRRDRAGMCAGTRGSARAVVRTARRHGDARSERASGRGRHSSPRRSRNARRVPVGRGFGRRTHLSTERRTDGGRGVGLAGLDGQLNVPRNLRRHGGDAAGAALARGGRRDAEAQALTTEIRAATRGEGAAEMRARGRRRASRAGDARLLHPHGREARHSHAHSSHGSWYTCVSCARTDGDEDAGLWQ